MKDFFRKKLVTVIILIATVGLAGIAVFTAYRLYQLRQESVAPSAPTSKPEAADDELTDMPPNPKLCTALTFTIGRPDLCKSATIDKSTLKPGESAVISSTAQSNANNFTYAFYNLDNLRGPGDPKPICVKTGGDATNVTQECPSGSHHLIFKDPNINSRTTGSKTLKYENVFVVDENNGGKQAVKIQINAYFSTSDGQASLPKPECVVTMSASVSTPTPTPTPASTPTSTPISTPTSSPTGTPSPTPPGATATPTPTPTTPAGSATPTPTPPTLPDSGTSWPTLIGVGLGAILIILSFILAL